MGRAPKSRKVTTGPESRFLAPPRASNQVSPQRQLSQRSAWLRPGGKGIRALPPPPQIAPALRLFLGSYSRYLDFTLYHKVSAVKQNRQPRRFSISQLGITLWQGPNRQANLFYPSTLEPVSQQ